MTGSIRRSCRSGIFRHPRVTATRFPLPFPKKMNRNPLSLLDTSVYCKPLERNPLGTVVERWKTAGDSGCRISVFCEMEAFQGLHIAGRAKLFRLFERVLRDRIAWPLPPSGTDWFSRPSIQRISRIYRDCVSRIGASLFPAGFDSPSRLHYSLPRELKLYSVSRRSL